MSVQHFGYYINLDERGSFLADVRNREGHTIYEIRAGDEIGPDETSIFEDGFMSDKHDVEGLQDYLIDLGVIPAGSQILKDSEFEALPAPKKYRPLSM
jgi:hypothetical protein